ncbi:hypothetical protein CGK22_24670, partial [Vibrio parahaemolyticus]
HYNKKFNDDQLFSYDIKPKIYYLYSLLMIGEHIDHDTYTYISSAKNNRDNETKTLYKALELLISIKSL